MQRLILALVGIGSFIGANVILYREYRRRGREWQALLDTLATSNGLTLREVARRLRDRCDEAGSGMARQDEAGRAGHGKA